MSKIMVVEDDSDLRDIYSIRITAEGYDVVSAGDGEEALAVAVREKPNLILSDVMMPKISGFDMLDILRSTPETSHIKVIMMTALSAEDQRQRGERLGADRYLVKSQVGIEDVINTIHEVLKDKTAPVAPAAAPAAPVAAPAPVTAPTQAPVTAPAQASIAAPTPSINPTPAATPTPITAPTPSNSATPSVSPQPITISPTSTPAPATPPTIAPTPQVNHGPSINPAQ